MGRTLQTPTPKLRGLTIDVPVSKGGTGVKAASQLPAALGIVSKTHMGAPNGVAKAGVDGLLPADQLPLYIMPSVTIDGPDEIFQGQTVDFTITNYDVKTSYSVSVSAGTISRSGKTLTFVAPNSAQSVTMFVNGRECLFPVLATAPAKPSITAPVYGSSFIGPGYTFASSPFTGTLSTHLSTDWQIAADVDFNDIRYQSLNDQVNKTSWPLTNMNMGVSYLIRARYRAADGSVSAFSEPTRFTLEHNGIEVEYLLIAGGGGGASNWGNGAASGGGAAGGYRNSVTGELSGRNSQAEPKITLTRGQTYGIVIGAGGLPGSTGANERGSNGGNTTFAGIVALGGGGGYSSASTPVTGGSGGGAPAGAYLGGLGTAGQGFDGGNGLDTSEYRAGGGGGAGGPGQSGAEGSSGGPGLPSSITGTQVYRAGGGSGGRFNGGTGAGGIGGGGSTDFTGPTANTGSGGAGSRLAGAAQQGANGIAVVRYLGAQQAIGGVVTSANGYTIHTFTSAGNLVVNA